MSLKKYTKEHKVVDIEMAKPHIKAQMICVSCSYTCISLIPEDAKKYKLECPECKELKGVLLLGVENM